MPASFDFISIHRALHKQGAAVFAQADPLEIQEFRGVAQKLQDVFNFPPFYARGYDLGHYLGTVGAKINETYATGIQNRLELASTARSWIPFRARHPEYTLMSGVESLVILEQGKPDVTKIYPAFGEYVHSFVLDKAEADGLHRLDLSLEPADRARFQQRLEDGAQIPGFATSRISSYGPHIVVDQEALDTRNVELEDIDDWVTTHSATRLRGIDPTKLNSETMALIYDRPRDKFFIGIDLKPANFGWNSQHQLRALDIMNREVTANDLQRVIALRTAARKISDDLVYRSQATPRAFGPLLQEFRTRDESLLRASPAPIVDPATCVDPRLALRVFGTAHSNRPRVDFRNDPWNGNFPPSSRPSPDRREGI